MLAVMLSALACSAPTDTEIFIRRDQSSAGVYVFDFPMTDSLACYDISFFSRAESETLKSVELTVLWLSPSGESDNETVYMREITRRGTEEVYREGVRPAEPGNWRISVRPDVNEKDIAGLGLICKKKDGTR